MSKWERGRKFFRDNFFSGLLVVVPAVTSIYVFIRLLRYLYGKLLFLTFDKDKLAALLEPIAPEWAVNDLIQLFKIGEFLVLVLAIMILTALVGLITKIGLIRWLFGIGERILEKIPFVGIVYSAIKQLMESIFSGKGNFSKVVLVEFPRDGVYSIGFLSRETDETFEKLTGHDRMFNVFIPTTPNPTNGFLIVVPESQFKVLDITIDQAFKFIMSGGMVLPHEEADDVLDDDDSLIGRIKGASKKK